MFFNSNFCPLCNHRYHRLCGHVVFKDFALFYLPGKDLPSSRWTTADNYGYPQLRIWRADCGCRQIPASWLYPPSLRPPPLPARLAFHKSQASGSLFSGYSCSLLNALGKVARHRTVPETEDHGAVEQPGCHACHAQQHRRGPLGLLPRTPPRTLPHRAGDVSLASLPPLTPIRPQPSPPHQ